jgi:hypothetical protein
VEHEREVMRRQLLPHEAIAEHLAMQRVVWSVAERREREGAWSIRRRGRDAACRHEADGDCDAQQEYQESSAEHRRAGIVDWAA